MVLEKINAPGNVKKLSKDELPLLARELRQFIVKNVAENGGHLASNLGDIELTIALHRILNFPEDKLIWDVGHQSYAHKILTGRRAGFSTLRQKGGITGFSNPKESDCDAFVSGHSSTSISVALGFAEARELTGGHENVVAVIGDGAMTGGMAYEALNNASMLKSNLTIILNDNQMSISPNVGGMSEHLARVRTSQGYTGLKSGMEESLRRVPGGESFIRFLRGAKNGIKQFVVPGMIFENLGIMYLGPVDGHDIESMTRVISSALKYKGPVLVHVLTKKGRGYRPAEKNPSLFHGVGPFDIKTGKLKKQTEYPTYTEVFSRALVRKAWDNDRIAAVTAAMDLGCGLSEFKEQFPERFFDVGIAEAHAVTFSSALAAGGMIPVFSVYSSFLQRGFDQLVHDVGIEQSHVIFAVDRAGLVGRDGMTHQGIFDISYLTMIPGMTVMAPMDAQELSDMLDFAIDKMNTPVAIRYPRGEAFFYENKKTQIEYGKCEVLSEPKESEVLLFALGSMVECAISVAHILKKSEISTSIVNARFASPIDKDFLTNAAKKYDIIVSLEENVRSGGFGEHVLSVLSDAGFEGRFINVSIPDEFVPQGSVEELICDVGIDADSVAHRIESALEGRKS
ncbi:MAG: 1-deoxy-D-xylulose-5-phosphate synthase [Lachnospiraceae bacterium]|uniref:1-deoxy-D-xylulose-5-phosphate synthase n=1 Tax=Candidatus Weimeria bifida TaxID=2599074 RepID=A0A6N7J2W7_9FIRM|nr:1-deoxy-D-xylulose-5-phosphate synthase [Candidatus Weimeria bifida]RRF96184.1 MAG: 1-deoxy-D-xylulose-5-phosphate synthase [Lachnospiraceae bacterium]